jgi:succinate dehydrogenase / fumarate reductase iron-sulfur subunit
MSFLEMLDVLNEGLINKEIFQYLLTTIVAKEFAVLARCTSTVRPRSRQTRTYLSVAHENVQGYHFIEPFRAKAFPVIKDLVVDRSAFDRIQQAGGFVSINTPQIRLMQMRFQSLNTMLIELLMQQLVLVAEPV